MKHEQGLWELSCSALAVLSMARREDEADHVRLRCSEVERKWMHELATKGDAAMAAIPPNTRVDTGVDVIDKQNVAEFKARLVELKR
ncbi:hypothetical protein WMF26_27825 [Sorangium sp. So ce185]|uniref:hypothetical protein n=1 Tax=Sorangium sp. So ce185 TaxID=3133287 RepID=UPI003F5D73E8